MAPSTKCNEPQVTHASPACCAFLWESTSVAKVVACGRRGPAEALLSGARPWMRWPRPQSDNASERLGDHACVSLLSLRHSPMRCATDCENSP